MNNISNVSQPLTEPLTERLAEDFSKYLKCPQEKIRKIVRTLDNVVEFQLSSQNLKVKGGEDHPQTITKTVRVTLPDSKRIDQKKYHEILRLLIDQAEAIAGGRSFSERDLKKATVQGKKTGLRWKLVDKNEGFFIKILKFLYRIGFCKMWHVNKKQGIVELVLKESSPWYTKIFGVSKKRKIAIKAFKGFANLPKVPYKLSNETLQPASFQDPFTKVASYSYKYLEKDFVNHDYTDIHHIASEYIYILEKDNLTLVHKDDYTPHKQDKINAALSAYKNHLLKEFGKEKIEYLTHLARIDLENLKELTPEHVYRINVLATNIESHDMQSLIYKMQFLSSQLITSDEPFNQIKQDNLSQSEMRSMAKWAQLQLDLKEEEVLTSAQFKEAVKKLSVDENFSYQSSLVHSIIESDSGEIANQPLLDYLKASIQANAIFKNEKNRNTFVRFISIFTSEKNLKVQDFNAAFRTMQLYLKGMKEIPNVKKSMAFPDFIKQFTYQNPNLKFQMAQCEDFKDLTVSQILGIFEPIESKLTQSQVSQLMEALMPTAEERNKAYTGRRITLPVGSAYTQADKRFYKPWIEQQEVSQTFDVLEKDVRFDPYLNQYVPLTQEEKIRRLNEQFTHVLCKKHFFRPHPKEGYRVGALIPAPSDKDGTKRWYRVDRMVSGEHGLLFYVLEPVGVNSGLATYLLARSTSSNEYAYQNGGTIRNDLNPLNAPGYEGRRHLDQGLDSVRKEHTTPAWVDYQYTAGQEIKKTDRNVEKIHQDLVVAKQAFIADIRLKYGTKSLHQIVRTFDSELNDLMWFNSENSSITSKLIDKSTHLEYKKMIYHFANNYSIQSIENESQLERKKRIEEEKKAALKLSQYIIAHGKKDNEGNLLSKYVELTNALNANIIEPRESKTNLVELLQEYLPLNIQKAFELIDNYSGHVDHLIEAESILHHHAKSIGEDVKSKKTNGIIVAGHSLGGSAAQVEAYFMTAGSNRFPAPGTSVKVYLYDDPGMNIEDNENMFDFLFDHRKIIKEIDVNFEVYFSHDYGDLVPMCAPAHLGGITQAINKNLMKKCRHEIKKNGAAYTQDLIAWLKKKYPSKNPVSSDLDEVALRKLDQKLREFHQKMPFDKKIQWRDYLDFHANSGFELITTEPFNRLFAEKSFPQRILESGVLGEKEILAFFTEEIHRRFSVLIELKDSTTHTLEQETGGLVFKHETRFEMTKKQKEFLLDIASNTRKSILQNKFKVNFSTLGNYIRESSLKIPNSYQGFDEDFKCYELFEKIRRGDEKFTTEAGEKLSKRFPEIYKRTVKKGKLYKIPSSLIEESIKKRYRKLLKLALNNYINLLYRQASQVQANSLGGVKIHHLDQNILGGVGGHGDLSRKESRKIWGGGWFDAVRLRRISREMGMRLGPNFYGNAVATNKSCDTLKRKGHIRAKEFQNPVTGSLNVAYNIGPFI